MAEQQTSQVPPQVQAEGETVRKSQLIALQKEMEALREMVQSLLLAQSPEEEQPVLT